MFPVLFRHNKPPKVFCLTFGVHIKFESRIFYFIDLQNEEDYEGKESSSV